MNSDKKLSVIIPTYNRAEFLKGSIESALVQGMEDIEVIVVDDGSTDGTYDVVDAYGEFVRYIRTDNNGPAVARNVGMRASTGRYISYLDDDDLYYSYKSKVQCSILDANPEIGMVYSDFSAFDNEGFFDFRHIKKYHKSAYSKSKLTYDNIFSEKRALTDYIDDLGSCEVKERDWDGASVYMGDIFDRYLMNTVVFTNSMVFRREVVDHVGLQDARFHMFHDLEFALRICKAYRVAFADIPTYKLRYHPSQISTRKVKDGELVSVGIQRDLLRVTKYHGLFDQIYFEQHKAAVMRQLARLSRATAIPMMAVDTESRHINRYYPRRARKYLDYCARLGFPERTLMFMTYLPSLLRRIGFMVLARLSRVN